MIIDSVAALHGTPSYSRAQRRRSRLLTLLGVTAAAGALLFSVTRPTQDADEPLTPVAISALADDSRTAVHGEVAEIFGNKFVVADPTGRVLIETGRAGEGGELVAAGETVTVEGRFHRGFMHAERLTRGDGSTLELHPPHPPGKHPPHHGPHAARPATDATLAAR